MAMPLPPAELVQAHARALAESMTSGDPAPVQRAGDELLAALSAFYGIPVPPLQVLGVRPHRVDGRCLHLSAVRGLHPSTHRIRVWMRTAIRQKVSSPKALLNTLLHEFCHHLDSTRLSCPESFHTRGFFTRIDHLYHLALATPPGVRRPLRWVKRGAGWAIDWRALRR